MVVVGSCECVPGEFLKLGGAACSGYASHVAGSLEHVVHAGELVALDVGDVLLKPSLDVRAEPVVVGVLVGAGVAVHHDHIVL
jgi:hypothetical protein